MPLTADLPFLDLSDPDFSTRSQAVLDARHKSWCARTPYGLAVLRHREAGELLRDRRLRQGSHAWPRLQRLEGSFAEFWSRSIISLEGPGHKALRKVAMDALSEDFIAGKATAFAKIGAELAENLPEHCDFVEAFAHPFSGRAIATVLGLDQAQANALAQDASALGLAMGIDCLKYQTRFNAACDRLMDLSQKLIARAQQGQDADGLVSRMVGADVSEQELIDLIVIMIFGGVDTTRAQLGFAVTLFARHPEQWEALREDPSLVAQAVEEIIRQRPTTTWASREVVDGFEHKGVALEPGQTVHVLVHATGMDPEIASDPGFDIRTRRKGHFGFGGGAHHCLGQAMARSDIAAALLALSNRVKRFEVEESAEFLPDSGNTSAKRLPVRLAF